MVEAVTASFAAIGQIEIRPSIPIVVDHRDCGTDDRDLRHDVVQLRIELRRFVGEVDAGRPAASWKWKP
jgi:hypothetical protein